MHPAYLILALSLALVACVPTPGALSSGQANTAEDCAQLRAVLTASPASQTGMTEAELADAVDRQMRAQGCDV